MSMLRRFFAYYRPYKFLFWLDMGAAVLSSVLSIFFPALTRELLRTWIPNQIWRSMVICFIAMFAIYAVQACFTYIRIRWGHQLGVYVENDMRKDLFSHLQKLSFGYYDHTKHPNSLILSAKDKEGHRLETIELNIKTWKVVQSRALQNGKTKFHDEIVKLVEQNIGLFKKAA